MRNSYFDRYLKQSQKNGRKLYELYRNKIEEIHRRIAEC